MKLLSRDYVLRNELVPQIKPHPNSCQCGIPLDKLPCWKWRKTSNLIKSQSFSRKSWSCLVLSRNGVTKMIVKSKVITSQKVLKMTFSLSQTSCKQNIMNERWGRGGGGGSGPMANGFYFWHKMLVKISAIQILGAV